MINVASALFVLFSALGIAYDKFTFDKQKTELHRNMVEWWYKIGNVVITDYEHVVIRSFLGKIDFLIRHRTGSLKYLFITACISWLLTTGGALFGEYLRGGVIDLPFFIIYINNYPFDVLAIIITVKIIYILSKKQTLIRFILLIFTNILIVYIISLLCLFMTDVSNIALECFQSDRYVLAPYPLVYVRGSSPVIEQDLKRHQFTARANCRQIIHNQDNLCKSFKLCFQEINAAILLKKSSIDEPRAQKNTIKVTIIAREKGRSVALNYVATGSMSNGYIFGALSTFTPVLILLVVILAARLARFILDFAKFITTYLLDRYTESAIDKDKKKFSPEKFIPGTLTGVLIGILTASLSLLKEFLHYWHQRH